MSAEHKDERAVFKAALKITSKTERAAYLKQACGSDVELLARVEALLNAHEEAGNFLEVPAFGANVTLESPRIEGPGTTIGRYKLLELIGEGGMGLVYLAEQQEPIRRRAALKIVKLGMDTKQVIARFEAEKQMLALLDHPNIARVYDAGTTETGRPYFVMEYVKGQSITDYCDQRKSGIEDRLKLFRQVCEGVQYAHQKGIIHRDIKPSNILVTVEGDRAVPKIIDFGIAKAVTQQLTEQTLFTQQGQLLGTPEYMSPEQTDLATQDIDTRSDIYSLGVVLYQLLAGMLPFGRESFEKGGFAEIQRVIQEVDPPNPSTALSKLGDEAKKIAEKRKTQVVPLARRLHRELEWIPLKAMRKERVRRYRSASELADDIQNYLNGNPLIAGPETTIYRVKKFVRRHSASVLTTLLVALAIILGFVVSTAMYFRAEHALQREATARIQAEQALQREAAARAEAQRQAHISQAVNEFLNKDLLTSFDPHKAKGQAIIQGRPITVIEILDNAAEKLEGKFKDAPLIEASIRDTLGMTYMSLGKYTAAKPHYERALELRRSQLGEKHPDTLTSMDHLGSYYTYQFDFNEAEPLHTKVLEIRRRVLGEEHPDTLDSMNHLGWVYYLQDRFNEAEPLWVKALEISRRVLGEEHSDTLWYMKNMAHLYSTRGRYKEAELLLVKGVDGSRRIMGEENLDTAGYMDALGELYYTQGRYNEAEPLFVKVLEIQQRVWGEENPNTVRGLSDVGKLYCMQGRYNEAEPLFVKELEILRHEGEPWIGMLDVTENITMLVEHLGPLGIERYKAGAYEEAAETLKRVDEYRRTVLHKDSQRSEIAYIAMALHRLGRNQEAQASLEQLRGMFEDGKYASEENYLYEAEQLFAGENSKGYLAWERIKAGKLDEASQLVEELGASKDLNIATQIQSINKVLTRALYRRIRSGPADKSYGEVVADYEAAVRLVPNCAQAFNDLAWLRIASPLAELHHGVKAVEAATKACELTNWKNPDYVNTLAAAYSEAGDFVAAIKWQKEAIGLLPEDNRAAWQSNYEARLKLYQSGKAYSKNFSAEHTIAWYKFNEAKDGSVVDSSGNNIHGKLIGDAKIISDPERGNALCLDGDGDYVDCGNAPPFNIPGSYSYTVAAWIKVNKLDKDQQALLTKGGGIEFERSGTRLVNTMGTMDVNDGKWHHIAMVYDETKLYLYMDGNLDNEVLWPSDPSDTATNEFPVLIGENAEERGHYWNGLIDDVRLYSYAFTEAEVKALYEGKDPPIKKE